MKNFFMDKSPKNMIIATTEQCVWKKRAGDLRSTA